MTEKNQPREILTFELVELRRRVADLEHLAAEVERQSRRLGAGLESLPMLVEEQRLLRTLIDTLPDCVFVKDAEGRFLINNPAHLRVIGAKSQEEVLGKTDLEVFPEKYGRQYYEDDRQVMETGEPMIEREEPAVDPVTGEERWLSSVKVPLRDVEGKIIGIVGTSRDITERLDMEKELSVYQAQLEFMVRTRTMELEQANAQLRQEITARDRIQSELRDRLEMETMVGVLMGQFVGATLGTIAKDIEPALALIGGFTGADHVCLSLFQADRLGAQPVYEWRASGLSSVSWVFEAQMHGHDGSADEIIPPVQDDGSNGESTHAPWPTPWFMERLARGETIHVPYLAELPEAADSEWRLWSRAGIRSLLIVPLALDDELAGLLAVTVNTEEKQWPDRDVTFLQLVAQVAATVLARVQGELAQRESEARYRALSEIISDYAYSLRFDEVGGMQVKWMTDSIARVTGYTVDELTEQVSMFAGGEKSAPSREQEQFFFIHPDDAPVFDAALDELRANRQANFEMRIVTKSGEVRWLDNHCRPMWDERQGRVTGALGSGRDVTEQKRAEQSLQASERRYRTLFESASDGISIHELDGRFLEANQGICERLGYTREELRQIKGQNLQAPEWAKEENTQALLETGRAVFQSVAQTRDGQKVPVEVNAQLIEYDGRPALLAVTRDVSERKRLETQLLQVQKMDAVGRLAGGLAHDFNNELTVIASYCDFLMEADGLDEGAKQWVREIERAAQRAGSLTKQLLTLGRRQVLEPEVLNLNDIVLDMSKMLDRVIGEDIEVTRWLAADLPNVRADRSQIEQGIMNLIVNARQAMPRGGELTIETGSVHLDANFPCRCGEVNPGNHVMLAVSDNGVGMDRETSDRIFEPFFTTKERGSGLGLATLYGIVKQSGGHVTVESEPGRGSTFRIYLPVVADEVTTRPETAATSSESAQDGPMHGSETVFLVEDDDRLRVLARHALEHYGYAVIEACSGPEALALARDYSVPIHLLLTDVVLPGGLNGLELAQKLREAHPNIKVLYVSGYSDATTEHLSGLETGAMLLSKPFTSAALARKVRAALDR